MIFLDDLPTVARCQTNPPLEATEWNPEVSSGRLSGLMICFCSILRTRGNVSIHYERRWLHLIESIFKILVRCRQKAEFYTLSGPSYGRTRGRAKQLLDSSSIWSAVTTLYSRASTLSLRPLRRSPQCLWRNWYRKSDSLPSCSSASTAWTAINFQHKRGQWP